MNCSCSTCRAARRLQALNYELSTFCDVVFPPLEWDMVEYLATHLRSYISKEKLMDHLYAFDPNDIPEAKIINVRICKIRKRLTNTPYLIRTLWGRGYGMFPRDVFAT